MNAYTGYTEIPENQPCIVYYENEVTVCRWSYIRDYFQAYIKGYVDIGYYHTPPQRFYAIPVWINVTKIKAVTYLSEEQYYCLVSLYAHPESLPHSWHLVTK